MPNVGWNTPTVNHLRFVKKRKLSDSESQKEDASKPKLRSRTPVFDIRTDYLYCGDIIYFSNEKQRLLEKRSFSEVATLKYVKTVLKQASDINDEWCEIVQLCVKAVNDLVAEGGRKYHHDCALGVEWVGSYSVKPSVIWQAS